MREAAQTPQEFAPRPPAALASQVTEDPAAEAQVPRSALEEETLASASLGDAPAVIARPLMSCRWEENVPSFQSCA